MPDIIYTPQFQSPAWHDNVDLVAAEGPHGFNVQFQSLQAELAALSSIVKQLNDAIVGANQTLQANNSAAQALQPSINVIQAACWGNIRVDGTIFSSSGNFTVTKVGTGVYDIFFNPPFSALPAVVVTAIYPGQNSTNTIGSITSLGGWTTDNAVVVDILKNQCRIETGDGSGVPNDRYFNFLAYGPTTQIGTV